MLIMILRKFGRDFTKRLAISAAFNVTFRQELKTDPSGCAFNEGHESRPDKFSRLAPDCARRETFDSNQSIFERIGIAFALRPLPR